MFRDWQRTLTQSSATALVARGSKWMSGSARAGTTRREAPARTTKPDITHCAFSRTRPRHLCSPLTVDSHGGRQYGTLPSLRLECSVLPVIREYPSNYGVRSALSKVVVNPISRNDDAVEAAPVPLPPGGSPDQSRRRGAFSPSASSCGRGRIEQSRSCAWLCPQLVGR